MFDYQARQAGEPTGEVYDTIIYFLQLITVHNIKHTIGAM